MAKSKITSEIAGRGDKNNVCTVTQEQDGYCIHCSADTAGGGYHIAFVPSVNPARISSMINRNLSLFTCGISLSEMSTIKQLINIKEAAAAFAATASFIGYKRIF